MASAGVKVATATHRVEADLLVLQLESAGIHAWLVDDAILGADPLLSAAVGGYKIHVADADAPAALEAIEEYRKKRADPDADVCLSCGAPMRPDDTKCAACGWSFEA